MGLFDKKSTTNQSTTNVFTDQSANAAEGSIALGSGAGLNIQSETNITTVDDKIAVASVEAARDSAAISVAGQNATAQAALSANRDVSRDALSANRDVNIRSLETTTGLAANAINTIAGVNKVASDERVDVLNSTNLALQSNQGLATRLADLTGAALERSQTPDSAVTKQLLWVVGAIVLGLVLIFSRNSSRRTS